MQLLFDAGKWNLYPVVPWFGFALLGSAISSFWFAPSTTRRRRIALTAAIGAGFVAGFLAVRLAAGYGNILPYGKAFGVAFFFVQKYPPSLAHNLLFSGLVALAAVFFMATGERLRRLFHPLEIYGRTPFFFYVIHIPLLALVTKRTGLLPYRAGGVGEALLAWIVLLVVMYPLCRWFGGVKSRSTNALIRMM